MRRIKATLIAVVAIVLVLAAGCGSSSKSGSGGHTLTIGILTDITGPGATNSATIPAGVKAGIGVAATEGYKFKYVVADTATSPAQALTAAHTLVEQDHVFAVIANSALTFAAAPYLASKGIPVVGAAVDGSEWITDRNMFSVIGTQDYTKVYSDFGLFFKMEGVTNIGSLGYGISPSSAESAKSSAIAAQAEGIKVGYLNANFPFGGTNTGPAVLAMKSAGIDGFTGSIQTTTAFAIIDSLRQDGVDLKAAIMATGYGGDLSQGGPGAVQAAQGIYFLTSFEPVEMNTPATQAIQNALKTYAGITTEPTFAEYQGYASVDAMVQGLKAAGSNATQASFINAMLGLGTYSGAGLYDGHSVVFALAGRGQASGADNCFFVVQFMGTGFHLVPGMDPLCGALIPGKTVSANS